MRVLDQSILIKRWMLLLCPRSGQGKFCHHIPGLARTFKHRVRSRAKPGDNDDKYYSSFPQNKDRELKLIIIQGVIDEIGPDPEWLCEESQAGNRLATDHLPRRVRVITITGTRLSLLKHLCLTWK